MSKKNLLRLLAAYAAFLPTATFALMQRSVVMTTGIRITVEQALANITGFLAFSIVGISIILFLTGSFMMVISHGQTDLLDKGKKTMKTALIGLSIVLGSYAILRTVLFLVYQ